MSIYHVTTFAHLTIDTGNVVAQTRHSIGPGLTDAIKGGALTGRLAMNGLLFLGCQVAGGWSFTIGAASGRKEKPLVLCHVAAPGGGPLVWEAARADREAEGLSWPSSIGMPRSSAWLTVSFLPGLMSLSGLRLISMLGDAEQCFAWTLFDHGQPGKMEKAA